MRVTLLDNNELDHQINLLKIMITAARLSPIVSTTSDHCIKSWDMVMHN